MTGSDNIEWQELKILFKEYNIDMNKPFKDLTDYEQNIVINGPDRYIRYQIKTKSGNNLIREGLEGIKPRIERLYMETNSEMMRQWYQTFMMETTCPTCKGKRLNEQALAVYIGGKNIHELTSLSVSELLDFFANLKLTYQQEEIAKLILQEIKNRLMFLKNVGLDYLTLSRSASTLSGGEAQRIRLATQIGSKLTGVLYVLDEPSIGLHQKDNQMLINALKNMRDLGNTLIVVEHDIDTMLQSDYIVDIGPGSGVHGGEVVACGSPKEVMSNPKSLTGQYLCGKKKIEVPVTRRKGTGKSIDIYGACGNNLKNVNVKIPLGMVVCVTGVSGSGKSTLINETLHNALYKKLGNNRVKPLPYKRIEGLEYIDKVIDVSQEPIGRTPRSNPATYTGVFDYIRELFASTNEARMRGYDKGRFSFNVSGGRCEKCRGDGLIRVPMHFLPDVYVPCEECGGKRYNQETLEIKYKDKSIYDVLDMTIEQALEFFKNIPSIKRKLQTLNDVGLGYIKLGQSATTLSGGEAQRLKLAYELQKRSTGQTLYILDEPTTGLHIDDVKNLIEVINRLVVNGDSVIIIEHNLDVIKCADYIIDIGKDGGIKGGEILGVGTPEDIAKIKDSYTGQYLKDIL